MLAGHGFVCLAMISAACVPTFEGERPRELRITNEEARDAGTSNERDAGVRVDGDAGFVDAGQMTDAGPPRDGGPPPYMGPTFVDDVEPILVADCQGCHSNPVRFGAPMPLLTFADLNAPAPSDGTRPVYELVAQRVVPMSGVRIMPPAGAMAVDRVQVVVEWALEGAPEGPRTRP